MRRAAAARLELAEENPGETSTRTSRRANAPARRTSSTRPIPRARDRPGLAHHRRQAGRAAVAEARRAPGVSAGRARPPGRSRGSHVSPQTTLIPAGHDPTTSTPCFAFLDSRPARTRAPTGLGCGPSPASSPQRHAVLFVAVDERDTIVGSIIATFERVARQRLPDGGGPGAASTRPSRRRLAATAEDWLRARRARVRLSALVEGDSQVAGRVLGVDRVRALRRPCRRFSKNL